MRFGNHRPFYGGEDVNVGALSATIGAVITVAAKMLLIGNSP
ncbi:MULTISPECIES: hypothetical protein [unclassified Microcystis]|nr:MULTISPECIES: hypothetical protein [unclassified Microcystis]